MQKNYNENLVAGAAIRDDKGRRISKLFEASHPKMTVGYAKNLIMPDTPTEQEFNFRQSGGGVIEDGVAVIDKVKGKSLVWNQLASPFSSTDTIYAMTASLSGNKTTFAARMSDATIYANARKEMFVVGHKYAIRLFYTPAQANTIRIFISNIDISSTQTIGTEQVAANSKKEITAVFTAQYEYLTIYPLFGTASDGASADVEYYLTDLTQMFGAGNEPTTYEEFLSRKPKVADEYAYNEGTIVNNKVEKVRATGVNLWDEEVELGSYDIKTGEKVFNPNYTRSKNFTCIIPSSSIYLRTTITISAIYILFYDREQKYLSYTTGSNRIINIPSDCCYINIVWLNSEYGSTTYNHDICINLSDPAFNGQYFPYEKHELDLSWVKEIKDTEGVKLFEDGMKSAGAVFDEVRKGRAIKRIGVKVFDGTEEWKSMDYQGLIFFTDFIEHKRLSNNIISDRYETGHIDSEGKYICGDGGEGISLWLRDSSFADLSALKAYLAQHPLVVIYELAEPIEVEYDEKNLTYPVVAGGTEEAIASEPSTAFRADIGYGIDAVKTILDLKARVEALEGK